MHSGQLTRSQLDHISRCVERGRHYLDCLTGRMSQKHFPAADLLFAVAEEARAAVARLAATVDQLKADAVDEPILPP
jgi:hypothetical protein